MDEGLMLRPQGSMHRGRGKLEKETSAAESLQCRVAVANKAHTLHAGSM